MTSLEDYAEFAAQEQAREKAEYIKLCRENGKDEKACQLKYMELKISAGK